MDPGGGTGCVAAKLCFEDSGTVSPRKSHPKETAATPQIRPVSQKPRSGAEFSSISGGANCDHLPGQW